MFVRRLVFHTHC